MEFWIKAAQLVLSLSILIVLHELGHFIPARWFKTRVEKFYLFFDAGFSLFKFKKGETEYGIGWIPLGGYVKISGMIDESMDKEQMEKPAEPWEFRSKPTWQRLIIMIGGVTVNLILGFMIYMMILFVWGEKYITPSEMDHGYNVAQELEQYGFQDGDKVLKVEGEELDNAYDLDKMIMLRGARELYVEHPNGETETITLPEDIDYTLFQKDQRSFTLRVTPLIDTVVADSPAEKGGLLKYDSIVAVNGQNIAYWDEFTDVLPDFKNDTITLDVVRGTETVHLSVKTDSLGKIGVAPEGKFNRLYDIHQRDYSFGESITAGFASGYWTLHDYVAQMKFVFTSKGSTSIGGFGAIGGLFTPKWDWRHFWQTTALLSIMLAFMNILPIPALDGGHVMFLTYEMISGKPPSDKFLTRAQIVGMILLISLLLYANGLDIYRWIFG